MKAAKDQKESDENQIRLLKTDIILRKKNSILFGAYRMTVITFFFCYVCIPWSAIIIRNLLNDTMSFVEKLEVFKDRGKFLSQIPFNARRL